jgi:Zn-finger nucleic acid-binding protein
MQCPKCAGAMESVTHNQNTLERCTQCKGIWFDGSQHKLVKREKGAANLDTGSVKVGKEYDHMQDVGCPRCDLKLDRRPDPMQPHIFYDVCPQGHGIYFDAGEFRDFVEEDIGDFFKSLPWFRKS